MKVLEEIAYKEYKGIITGILENGNIAITLQYRVNNILQGYIRKEVKPYEIRVL